MSERTLSAAEADLMIGRTWFSDVTTRVTVHDEPVRVDTFDAEARTAAAGDSEMVMFVHSLTVEGTLRLGAAHSVYVVLGELRCGRIELGDATLAASGPVIATDYVFAPRSKGVFAVGPDATTDDATTPALPPVIAPIVVWHDPRRGIDRVFAHRDGRLRSVPIDALPGGLQALYDTKTETFTDMAAVLAILRSGSWR
jgi:hypothetical protein